MVSLYLIPRGPSDLFPRSASQSKGTDEERHFVEYWDIGGSANHENTQQVFYDNVHGIILVHDLTNKKSEANLSKWLAAITAKGKLCVNGCRKTPISNSKRLEVVCQTTPNDRSGSILVSPTSPPNSITSPPVPLPSVQQASTVNTPPVLVVGTNLDQVQGLNRTPSASFLPSWNESCYRPGFSTSFGSFAASHGYPQITVNCNSSSSFTENSYNGSALSAFLRQVIRFKRNNKGVGIRRDPSDDYDSTVTQLISLSNQNILSMGNQGNLPYGRNFGGAAFDCLAFLAFLSFDSLPVEKHAVSPYPLSVLVFAFNPFSIFAFGCHSIGIIPVLLTVYVFVSIAKDRTWLASILCALSCYLNIYSGYLILAVLAQCRKCKLRLLISTCIFISTIAGLLYATYAFDHSWGFLKYCYLSNIFALNTTPNLGLFWYMYLEMFTHFNVFFVWTMQLIIATLCVGLLLRFYEDPLFLALVIAMTTGALRPYNSISDFGCTLALLTHWRHIFPYFKNGFILSLMMTVALILAPLFFLTWLHTSTSNANFYFSASLIVGIVRVQLLAQAISSYLRYEFHEKFGPNPRLSTGAKIVPCIRS
ncbi:unnamed protein product [Rodentolepis nana]|uniref:Uncharacterized protein n=1 Tax=Rodentolepis nana TaxID=102285 RepID=A0A0R3TU19_RODNA|nr:unnamed protein product [Rodentolepis nana]